MSTPQEPPASGRAALLAALEVRRYLAAGLAAGLVIALGVFGLFVGVLAGGDPREPLGYYLGLAFVVFVTTGMLAATVLVTRRVLALAVSPASLVRKTATGGLVAGLLWLLAAAGLVGGTASPAWPLAAVTLPWAPILTLPGVWAVHTRLKRSTRLRPASAVGAWLVLGGALLLAGVAAADLVALAAGEGRAPGLFTYGLVAAAAGSALQAVAALDAGLDRLILPLALPLVGLAAWLAVGASALGLAAVAATFALAWLALGYALRSVADEAVPGGLEATFGQPEPDPEA